MKRLFLCVAFCFAVSCANNQPSQETKPGEAPKAGEAAKPEAAKEAGQPAAATAPANPAAAPATAAAPVAGEAGAAAAVAKAGEAPAGAPAGEQGGDAALRSGRVVPGVPPAVAPTDGTRPVPGTVETAGGDQAGNPCDDCPCKKEGKECGCDKCPKDKDGKCPHEKGEGHQGCGKHLGQEKQESGEIGGKGGAQPGHQCPHAQDPNFQCPHAVQQ